MDKYPEKFILMTWHRAENTYSKERMKKILAFINALDYKIILPLHPRTRKILIDYNLMDDLYQNENITILNPVGYREMTDLLGRCKLVISDSGGVSKEASFAGKICFSPLDLKLWPELIEAGYIHMVNVEDAESVQCNEKKIKTLMQNDVTLGKIDFFGEGKAAQIIVDTIERALKNLAESDTRTKLL